MPRAPKKPPPPPTIADVASSNSTAAHFVGQRQPVWLQQNSGSASHPPSAQFLHDPMRKARSLAKAATLPPDQDKTRHDSVGSVRNSIGLPSPVPSSETTSSRASPENSIPQASDKGGDAVAMLPPNVTVPPQHTPLQRPQTFPQATTKDMAMPPPPERSLQQTSAQSRPPSRTRSIPHNGTQLAGPGSTSSPRTGALQNEHLRPATANPRLQQAASTTTSVLSSNAQARSLSYFDPVHCKATIERYFNKDKIPQNQQSPASRKLEEFMMSAINLEPPDSFFFFLLQLTCICALDPRSLPKVMQDVPNILVSLSIFSKIVSSLADFSTEFAQHFASFPKDISQMHLLPAELIASVSAFLRELPARHREAWQNIQRRGFSISPLECWSSFSPITTSCSRLLHLHYLYAFNLWRPETIDLLDKTFLECQQEALKDAVAPIPGVSAGIQQRFEIESRMIMNNAIRQYGNLPSPSPGGSLPLMSQPAGNQFQLAQHAPIMQRVGHATAAPSFQTFSTGPMMHQPIMPRPLSSSAMYGPTFQNQAGCIAAHPQSITPVMQQMGPQQPRHNARRSTSSIMTPLTPQPYHQISAESAPGHVPMFARTGELPTLPADAHPEFTEQSDEPEKSMPLYQVVHDLPLTPKVFSTEYPLLQRTFNISEEDIRSRPVEAKLKDGHDIHWRVNRNTRIFRFRCAKHVSDRDETSTKKLWMDTPTYWPLHVYFTCNDQQLEPRRSNQWHKNLPVDLTSFLKVGENTVKVFINRLKDQPVESFVAAVELVKLRTAEDIIKKVSERPRKATAFVESLATKPTTAAEADNDLSIVSESVQVAIYDPITANGICKTPVRGTLCTHKECFDLETYLQSRIKKPESDVYEADNWLCPICKTYAAPSALYIDEYFVMVRSVLNELGRPDARMIVVNKNGRWTVKEKPREEQGQSSNVNDGQNSKSVEVVELD